MQLSGFDKEEECLNKKLHIVNLATLEEHNVNLREYTFESNVNNSSESLDT